ncbi:hypothetical protein NQ176_g6254 [Zarea fungicola]|uniref:Uncharacterized protein n=1 Tax=Zarea fungicola TaxID=93591 RepID=A0ACC1N492_9HYPO|nr:hypothetical protein NQ176_g6254 [Lecanicillium fungicola]
MEASSMIAARHIQNMTDAKTLEPHWGYADRAVPCTSDPGSCAYLDVVYGSHDRGMLYSGVLWLVLAGILLVWAVLSNLSQPMASAGPVAFSPTHRSGLGKVRRTIATLARQYLLPDAVRFVFGRTTRLQVAVLCALSGYLLIFSFVGIAYNTWVTPIKGMPGIYNTRTSLGPWSDRIGILAYALTPLSIMLSSRESLLSLITGVPYQSFNFLHRWLGYIILLQGGLHTISWCIIEMRLYQPQPTVGLTWMKEMYMIWGVIAMFLLTCMVVLSTPWGIRWTGYEFFRKSHYVLAMIYIGACWGHWAKLQCFMLPSLIFWFIDRCVRLARTAFLHYGHHPSGGMGFKVAEAAVTRFPDALHGDVIRLDMENDQDPWKIGQHYYLCFTQSSIWQSHPFTPLNVPVVQKGTVKHSYLLRAKSGETKKIAELSARKQQLDTTLSIILTGPYGESLLTRITPDANILCIAGGTGITYVLPILLDLASRPIVPDRKLELIWAVRHASDTDWVRAELDSLYRAQKILNLKVRVFATRELGSETPSVPEKATSHEKDSSAESSQSDGKAVSLPLPSMLNEGTDRGMGTPLVELASGAIASDNRRPDLSKLVNDFTREIIRGRTAVFCSGPGGMISELREIVAGCNSASRVWRGDERYDVDLVCDDRLEW